MITPGTTAAPEAEPDELNELDKRIAVALQQDGRASWRSIASSLEVSVGTVARRGQRLLNDGVVRVVATLALGAVGPQSVFFIRINCAPGTQFTVAAQVAENPRIRFCTLVTGTYDIMAEFIAPGPATENARSLVDLQRIPGIVKWRSDLIMHVHKMGYDWGKQVIEAAGTPELPVPADLPEPAPPICSPAHFDEIDRAVVSALAANGRESFSAIAADLDINESSVRRRFERLRSSRCVDIVTLVPSSALGMEAETLMDVTVAPARLHAVADVLAALPAVRYLAVLLDSNTLLCEIIAPTVETLYAFVTTTLAELDGVEGWTANMELLYLKRGYVESPWWRAEPRSGAGPGRAENPDPVRG